MRVSVESNVVMSREGVIPLLVVRRAMEPSDREQQR
jgi:hypothetical protein